MFHHVLHLSTHPPGPGYKYSDLTLKRDINLFNNLIHVPPTLDALILLLTQFIIFFLLAWYLDAVLPGEHGSALDPWFLFSPTYWGCCRRKKPSPPPSSVVDGDEDVRLEQKRAFAAASSAGSADSSSLHPLVLVNLAKTYFSGCFNTGRKVEAVKGVSLCVEEGELLCMLVRSRNFIRVFMIDP